MPYSEYYFNSSDKKNTIRAVAWQIRKKPLACVFISHGMVEHILRYDELAGALNNAGFNVYGHDHLGHGKSVDTTEDFGYFGEPNGNDFLLKDIDYHIDLIRSKHPNVPIILLGHSMGSFLARQYICVKGRKLNGVIIMGTGSQPEALLEFGRLLCSALAGRYGWHHRSNLVNGIAMGTFNSKIKHPRTNLDWMTKNEERIDQFIEDPETGFIFTLNGFYNMFKSISLAQNEEYISRIPKDLPMFFVSGDEDPVGANGNGVRKAISLYKKAGINDIQCRFYIGARHEIINESNQENVFMDIINWIERII